MYKMIDHANSKPINYHIDGCCYIIITLYYLNGDRDQLLQF